MFILLYYSSGLFLPILKQKSLICHREINKMESQNILRVQVQLFWSCMLCKEINYYCFISIVSMKCKDNELTKIFSVLSLVHGKHADIINSSLSGKFSEKYIIVRMRWCRKIKKQRGKTLLTYLYADVRTWDNYETQTMQPVTWDIETLYTYSIQFLFRSLHVDTYDTS